MTPAMECPDIELLFDETAEGHAGALAHARECPACAALVEDHRQLEKDLFRIADPFPPAQFVSQVMAKVREAPAPIATEVRAGVAIVLATIALAIGSLALKGGGFASVGTQLAASVVQGRQVLLALGGGLAAAWRTAALPLAVGLSLVLALSLMGLKRLAGGAYSEAKVVS